MYATDELVPPSCPRRPCNFLPPEIGHSEQGGAARCRLPALEVGCQCCVAPEAVRRAGTPTSPTCADCWPLPPRTRAMQTLAPSTPSTCEWKWGAGLSSSWCDPCNLPPYKASAPTTALPAVPTRAAAGVMRWEAPTQSTTAWPPITAAPGGLARCPSATARCTPLVAGRAQS